MAGLIGEAGETGAEGHAGPRGLSGDVVSNRRLLIVMAGCTIAFLLLAAVVLWNQGRLSHALGRLDRNGRAIQVLVYEQCTERNATTVRQNALIDRAIEAEKRRTRPNAQTIRDLTAFRGSIVNCGPKP